MNGRAGQAKQVRKPPQERQDDVVRAVIILTRENRGKVTLRQIAVYLGMTTSTHLMKIVKGAWIADRISVNKISDNRAGHVYYWFVSREQMWSKTVQCDMPMDCSKSNSRSWDNSCKASDGLACPAQRIDFTKVGNDA